MKKQTITAHVSYSEIKHSDTAARKGIYNIPTQEQYDNIKLLCEKVFEPVRRFYNVPIYISSCFRSLELNTAIGGASSSQHLANNGAAMDLDADRYGRITNKQIFDYIYDKLGYDQLIWEAGTKDSPAWVHVSYKEESNRKEALIMYKENGESKYMAYNEDNLNKL